MNPNANNSTHAPTVQFPDANATVSATPPPMLCTPRSAIPPDVDIPPAVKEVACSECGATLLATPSSRRLFDAGTFRPICIRCVPEPPPGSRYVPVMTPDQVREVREMERADIERN